MNRKNLIDLSKKPKAKSPKRPIADRHLIKTPIPKNLIEIYKKNCASTHYITNIKSTPQQKILDSNITAINRTDTNSPSLKNESHSFYTKSNTLPSLPPNNHTSPSKIQTTTSSDPQPPGSFPKSPFSSENQEISIEIACKSSEIDSKFIKTQKRGSADSDKILNIALLA
jgi:hypothetical protein